MKAMVCMLVLVGAALPHLAAAQRVEMPESGRVRVTAAGWRPAHVVGTIDHATADSVMIRSGDSLVAIPRARVTRVEVPAGRRRHVTAGLLIGAGVGAATGAVVGLATCGEGSDCVNGEPALLSAAGAGLGAITGAAGGALWQGDRWRDASATPGVAVAPAPRHGIALAVRIATR